MSVIAGGAITMKMRKKVPDKIIKLISEEFHLNTDNLDYEIEFDGNIWLSDIIDELEILNPYIEIGKITYWSDEGNANAFFDAETEMWIEEWQETYYPSDLPDCLVCSTSRMKEIISTIVDNIMDCSDSELARKILLEECKLTDKEISIFGLSWLKDLEKDND